MLKKELKEKINDELMKKLGILMSREMEAEITWCAVIALWFQIC